MQIKTELAGCTALLVVALSACVPEVVFTTGSSGTGGAASSSTHSASSSSASASSSLSATGSATTTTTGSTTTGAGGCHGQCTDASKCLTTCASGDPCDCDNDHYYYTGSDLNCAALAMTKGYKGPDCFDCNASAKPEPTTMWFTQDRGDGSFDYTCSNGTPSEEYSGVCTGSGTCPGHALSPLVGCGSSSTLYGCKCVVNGLNLCASCAIDMSQAQSNIPMGCH